MKFNKGDIITSKKWPEPVQVESVEVFENDVIVKGFLIKSKRHVNDILSSDELHDVGVLGNDENFTEDPSKVFLFLEAKRYRFASLYDPLLAMSTSKVDPLPHQIEAVYGKILKNPRIRFLIADDPGAGKTIMAGLILKELKLRGLVDRILIIAPGHLRDQWVREMDERFKESFVVMSREQYKTTFMQNPWRQNNQIIASMDFAKQDDILSSLSAVTFDLVIVDEAHKMSAYASTKKRAGLAGVPLKVSKSKRYRLGEVLSRISEHLLFLTATPHRGDPENFRLFLDLLQPGFFATAEMLQKAARDRDNPLFIRRLKEDLKDFDGKPLFVKRNVITRKYDLSVESQNEKDLYNKLTKYVRTEYNLGMSEEKRKRFAFAQAILQRRLASSTYALLRSLERRRGRLQDVVDGKVKTLDEIPEYTEEEIEDMTDEEREKYEEMLEKAVPVTDKELLKVEISRLDELIKSAQKIIDNEEEIKLKELKKTLKELEKVYAEEKDKKILIFTEAKDTLMYLVDKIRSWGYSVTTIHGGMGLRERVAAEREFKEKTQVMVATEAAGEGINLQFCHLMVNYDIPWNPNRLEQRMGRIHRYGQTKEVYIVNLVAEDTREGMVLARLFDKLETIREHLGDKAFDVIGELLDRDLSHILVDAAINAKTKEELMAEIDVIPTDIDALNEIKKNLDDSLATHTIDFTRIKEMRALAEEKRLIPEYTEEFFISAFEMIGGRMKKLKQDRMYAVEKIPSVLIRISQEDEFKLTHGVLPSRYNKATFDKSVAMKNPDAQFLSLGHPLFEAMMRYIERKYSEAPLVGSTYIDPDGVLNGYLLFYEGEIKDGTGDAAGKRLFCTYVSDKTVEPMSPDILWDLEKGEAAPDSIDVPSLKSRAQKVMIDALREYMNELKEDREKRAEIKEKYGLKSLDILIQDLDEKLLEKQIEKEQGMDVSLAMHNYEERKSKYEAARKELADRIVREKELTLSMPSFIGIVRVVPRDVSGDSEALAENKKRIELIGMEIAMKYEMEHGRIPEDVSSSAELGFDIRSLESLEGSVARYIEVKARAGKEYVEMTRNEWIKARRFGDKYYLYVIWNATTDPELHIVRNPHENLKALAETQVVRYKVDVNDIIDKEVKE